MAKPAFVDARYKGLLSILTGSHRFQFAPSLLFGWMLDEVLTRFGAKMGSDMPPEAAKTVADATSEYVELVRAEEPFEDVLGNIYMALASKWGQKALGQYFTPQSVSTMMGRMLVEGAYSDMGPGRKPPNGAPMWRVADPTCGSGVMMLSLLRIVLQNEGPEGLLRFSVTGIDLDYVCARMFAVQHLVNCWSHDLTIGELCVYRGNALGPASELKTLVYAIARQHCTSAVEPEGPATPDTTLMQATQSLADGITA